MADVERDLLGLATCIHYILTRIGPMARPIGALHGLNSAREIQQIEKQLLAGYEIIVAGAESLSSIVQVGWPRQDVPTTLSEVKMCLNAIICEFR